MNIIDRTSAALRFPSFYRLFSRLVGGRRAIAIFLAEYVQPQPGERILDLGCGVAEVLDYLPAVQYTGLDISGEYIAAAKARFGNRGQFWRADIGHASIGEEAGTFDLTLAMGIVHHLDDAEAANLFAYARRALRPGGRLVTLDGCCVTGQSAVARWLLDHDRGKHVRAESEYERLASVQFANVQNYQRDDLLRIPYTHLIMRCSKSK